MTVEAIKEAIAGLPDADRQALAAWLNELDYDAWDRQMVRDFSGAGRGNALVEKMKREITQGRAVPFSEGAVEAGRREPRKQVVTDSNKIAPEALTVRSFSGCMHYRAGRDLPFPPRAYGEFDN